MQFVEILSFPIAYNFIFSTLPTYAISFLFTVHGDAHQQIYVIVYWKDLLRQFVGVCMCLCLCWIPFRHPNTARNSDFHFFARPIRKRDHKIGEAVGVHTTQHHRDRKIAKVKRRSAANWGACAQPTAYESHERRIIQSKTFKCRRNISVDNRRRNIFFLIFHVICVFSR